MPRHETLRPDVRLFDLIARELRRQRLVRGPTLQGVADLLSVERSTVARYESGEIPLPVKAAKKLDAAWSLEELFENLVKHAKAGKTLDWWETYKEFERQARVIKAYAPSLIPGLLQREGYARGLFVAGRRTDADEAVAERLERQAVLTGPQAAEYFAILDPAALYRRVGETAVMADQLEHLLRVSELPNVYLRVVSETLTGYGGVGGPITVIQTADASVALSRYGLAGLVLTDPDDVQAQAVEFDRIGMVSMTTEASRNLISKTLDGL